jgi:hypothetical protein
MTVAEDETTDIRTAVNGKSSTAAAIYDLQGRRVKSLPAKGLYIIDGRKTIVR